MVLYLYKYKKGICLMNKKQEFLDFIDKLMTAAPYVEISEGAKIYLEALRNKEEVEKPMFTENGKLVLQYMKDNLDTTLLKAKDIAEGLFISSRTVSGAMRKLVSDGFVEKVGQDPVIYTITEKGKEIEII